MIPSTFSPDNSRSSAFTRNKPGIQVNRPMGDDGYSNDYGAGYWLRQWKNHIKKKRELKEWDEANPGALAPENVLYVHNNSNQYLNAQGSVGEVNNPFGTPQFRRKPKILKGQEDGGYGGFNPTRSGGDGDTVPDNMAGPLRPGGTLPTRPTGVQAYTDEEIAARKRAWQLNRDKGWGLDNGTNATTTVPLLSTQNIVIGVAIGVVIFAGLQYYNKSKKK